jgi:hypothetical protein
MAAVGIRIAADADRVGYQATAVFAAVVFLLMFFAVPIAPVIFEIFAIDNFTADGTADGNVFFETFPVIFLAFVDDIFVFDDFAAVGAFFTEQIEITSLAVMFAVLAVVGSVADNGAAVVAFEMNRMVIFAVGLDILGLDFLFAVIADFFIVGRRADGECDQNQDQ